MSRRTLLILTVLVIGGSAAWAQESTPAFEVASVRLENSSFLPPMVRTKFELDGYTARNASMKLLIKDAYGVDDKQISGGPAWVNSERYNIDARIDSGTVERLAQLPEAQRKPAQQAMLQALLADRFRLALHHDLKELPVYNLVIAKNGSKLNEAAPGNNYANGLRTPGGSLVGPHMATMTLGGGKIVSQGLPLDSFVEILGRQTDCIILNKTDLAGNYDFTLEWTPDSRHGLAEGSDLRNSAPSLLIAVEEQLGLRLEFSKAPIDTIVIDTVEHPTPN